MTNFSSYSFQRYNRKLQHVYTYNILPKILVRPSFTSSTLTHNLELMKIVGRQSSSSETRAHNLWKHRSQLIFCKNSRDFFQECTTLLNSFNFLEELIGFLEHRLMLSLWNTHLPKDLHFVAPISLVITWVQHFATSMPPPLSHYSLPKPKVPYPRPKCAYTLKLIVSNAIPRPWWNAPKKP